MHVTNSLYLHLEEGLAQSLLLALRLHNPIDISVISIICKGFLMVGYAIR